MRLPYGSLLTLKSQQMSCLGHVSSIASFLYNFENAVSFHSVPRRKCLTAWFCVDMYICVHGK